MNNISSDALERLLQEKEELERQLEIVKLFIECWDKGTVEVLEQCRPDGLICRLGLSCYRTAGRI